MRAEMKAALALQVYAKEEELCEVQAKLAERDTALKAYKAENSRFADMKDKFKADIASLQQQVCSCACPHPWHGTVLCSTTLARQAVSAILVCVLTHSISLQ